MTSVGAVRILNEAKGSMGKLLRGAAPLNGFLALGLTAAAFAVQLGAAATPATAAASRSSQSGEIAAFYRARGGQPLWLSSRSGAAEQQLISLLATADADRLNPKRYNVNRLRRAVEDQSLHMAYQPKVSLRDGSLRRVEALVRWDDGELGSVEPSRFIPLAEQHGLIDDLTLWGLRTILRQWVEWCDDGLDTSIAFNISALSLQHLDFPDLVERMCSALEVPTDRLVLELTEGATQPLVKLMDTLTRFRIKGIGLAIDDFGTGYSSLMQLRQLPFSEVKIDQAFVADVTRSRDCKLIVRGITDLAHGLGLIATAEGVETVEQLRIVQELGCDLVQGYLVSPPMDPDQLKGWQQQFRRRWPKLMADDNLALWGDVEANALGQR